MKNETIIKLSIKYPVREFDINQAPFEKEPKNIGNHRELFEHVKRNQPHDA
ncbi:MAG: hypothetical protein JW950_08980 [Deltaproteobacteria bacterium]|nr:hypothetical protein [Deltaproteobacteria bacterium]